MTMSFRMVVMRRTMALLRFKTTFNAWRVDYGVCSSRKKRD
jgi:hypothetical protein